MPSWLVRVIEKLMAKKKAQRFHSAAEVHELLEACLSHAHQPDVVKLPVQLVKKQQPTFGTDIFRTPVSRFLGLFSMLTLCTAIALGICLFPGVPQSPQQTNQTENEASGEGEVLGNGYVRKGAFIYFDGQRIDQAGKEDIDRFARFTELELSLAEDIDAASFKALSTEYTKDKNKVYYKWISPGRFWIVQLPQADVSSFEVLGFNFAKDNKHVWYYGKPLPEIDPATVELVNDGFVWKDAESVWYQHEKILGADAATFRHLEQGFYRDKNRVYWSDTPLSDADPDTFRTFGDDSPYGADQMNVWKASNKVAGLDAASFEAIHQSVYKDKNGVYASGYPVENADPKTFRRVADLDEHFTALLADENHYYVFLPYRGEVYLVTPANDSLKVKRQIWSPGTPQHRTTEVEPVAIAKAELAAGGWRKQNVLIDEATDANQLTKDQEAHLLELYKTQFMKAWEILRDGPQQETSAEDEATGQRPTTEIVASEDWRTDVVAFDNYLGELAAAGTVPNKRALAKRITLVPGGGTLDSEVFPVTDGAGGFIDMQPAEDTVQFRVNEALKGQKVRWEFELARDSTKSYAGVIRLHPKLTADEDAVPFLSTLFIKPTAGEKFSLDFKAGDILTLEGTIGDFAKNKGIAALQSPSGPVAIYHLDSAPHTVFWVGLTDVSIVGPTRKTTSNTTPDTVKPSEDTAAVARALLQASLHYDEQALKEIYASEVRLLPGNRLFHYGLTFTGKMTSFGASGEREKMLPALKKQADRDPPPWPLAAIIVNSFRIQQLDVPVGEYVTEPNQPSQTVFDKLRFKIEENDVLLKVSVPGAYRYLQLRKLGEQWKVVAEY